MFTDNFHHSVEQMSAYENNDTNAYTRGAGSKQHSRIKSRGLGTNLFDNNEINEQLSLKSIDANTFMRKRNTNPVLINTIENAPNNYDF